MVISTESDNSGSTGNQAPAQSEVIIPDVEASTQHVYVSESTKSEDGSKAIVTVSHNATGTLTGLGLRIHYDSSALTLAEISNLFDSNIIVSPSTTAVADTADYDGDASTDAYVIASWAAIMGTWSPASPEQLMTLTFDIAEGATGSAAINFSASSTTNSYNFAGQEHEVILSVDSGGDASEEPSSQLTINSTTGEVTLEGVANYEVVPSYQFTVTADNGAESATQDVGLLVADYLVSEEQSSYQGTADADVFALAGGSAQVTSGDGADVFILAPDQDDSEQPGMHTITDFQSGVDAFDGSAALMSAGYIGIAAQQGVEEDQLNLMFDASADVLALVDSNNDSLDNVFGSYFDSASKELTFFADTDSAVGQYELETFKVKVEGDVPEEDDFNPTLDAFIA